LPASGEGDNNVGDNNNGNNSVLAAGALTAGGLSLGLIVGVAVGACLCCVGVFLVIFAVIKNRQADNTPTPAAGDVESLPFTPAAMSKPPMYASPRESPAPTFEASDQDYVNVSANGVVGNNPQWGNSVSQYVAPDANFGTHFRESSTGESYGQLQLSQSGNQTLPGLGGGTFH